MNKLPVSLAHPGAPASGNAHRGRSVGPPEQDFPLSCCHGRGGLARVNQTNEQVQPNPLPVVLILEAQYVLRRASSFESGTISLRRYRTGGSASSFWEGVDHDFFLHLHRGISCQMKYPVFLHILLPEEGRQNIRAEHSPSTNIQ